MPDTEETKSTGLLNRLIAEKERPRADVFWSGDPVRAAVLKRRGVGAVPLARGGGAAAPLFRPARALDRLLGSRPRPDPTTATKSPRNEPRPPSWTSEPRLRGRAASRTPSSAPPAMHAAALFAVWERSGQRRSSPVSPPTATDRSPWRGPPPSRERRMRGGDHRYRRCQRGPPEGKPIGIVFPDAGGMGTLLIPNAVVLIAGAPHPEAARRFIDFLLAPETEKALAESEAAQIPVRSGLAPPAGMPALADLKPMEVSYGQLAVLLEGLTRGFLKEWVDRNAG